MLRIGTLLALAPGILALAGRFFGWPLDLFSHWTPHWGLLATPALALGLLKRRWFVAACATTLIIHAGWCIAPRWAGVDNAASDAPTGARPTLELHVACFNVGSGGAKPETVRRWLEDHDFDVFAILELGPEMIEPLKPLEKRWRFHHFLPDSSPRGIGIASKWPLDDVRVDRSGVMPAIEALVRHPAGSIEVLVEHPLPPVFASGSRDNLAALDRIARRVGERRRPLVLLADLNRAPWSPGFARLTEAGLEDPRRGRMIGPTWPDVSFALHFGIPIDHILTAGPWRVRDFVIGSDQGSDHRPVSARLELFE